MPDSGHASSMRLWRRYNAATRFAVIFCRAVSKEKYRSCLIENELITGFCRYDAEVTRHQLLHERQYDDMQFLMMLFSPAPAVNSSRRCAVTMWLPFIYLLKSSRHAYLAQPMPGAFSRILPDASSKNGLPRRCYAFTHADEAGIIYRHLFHADAGQRRAVL